MQDSPFAQANADHNDQVASQDDAGQDAPASDKQVGTVDWFNSQKGFGFIKPEDGGDDIFVHANNIVGQGRQSLEDGQRVEFTVGEGRKGPEAKDVVKL